MAIPRLQSTSYDRYTVRCLVSGISRHSIVYTWGGFPAFTCCPEPLPVPSWGYRRRYDRIHGSALIRAYVRTWHTVGQTCVRVEWSELWLQRRLNMCTCWVEWAVTATAAKYVYVLSGVSCDGSGGQTSVRVEWSELWLQRRPYMCTCWVEWAVTAAAAKHVWEHTTSSVSWVQMIDEVT